MLFDIAMIVNEIEERISILQTGKSECPEIFGD